jgi:large subunit ribosomal protein L13
MGVGASLKGPKYPRTADRLVKRMIRGMLPWDRPKGREAFKRLRCFIGNGDVSEAELKTAKKINGLMPKTFCKIKDVARILK